MQSVNRLTRGLNPSAPRYLPRFFTGDCILIVMYVPFCVTVLFCVLFVCECVLDNCHRVIGTLFDYPN
jgi:hypothetical protein